MNGWLGTIIAGSVAGVGLVYVIARSLSRKRDQVSSRREHPQHVEKTAKVLDAMMTLLEQQRTLSHEITDLLESKAQELKELIRKADETIDRLATRVSTFTPPQAETELEEPDRSSQPLRANRPQPS